MKPADLASLLSTMLPAERPAASPSASMWRYVTAPSPVSLGEGNTPLLLMTPASNVLLKDEGRNPGGGMVDRLASVLVTTAKAAGCKHVVYHGENSALAAALAVYAAHAGIRSSITLAPEAGDLEHLRASAASATLLVPGSTGPAEDTFSEEHLALASRLAAHSVACEISAQMQWKLPETLLVPGATPGDLLRFEESFAFLQEHGWTTSAHAPRCLAVHIAPPPHVRAHDPAHIAAQALRQFSEQVMVVEEDRVRESLRKMAHAGWMLSPGAAAGMAAAEQLPAGAAPIVLIHPRSATVAAREITQLLRIRRYPQRMPVGGIISPQ